MLSRRAHFSINMHAVRALAKLCNYNTLCAVHDDDDDDCTNVHARSGTRAHSACGVCHNNKLISNLRAAYAASAATAGGRHCNRCNEV